jgi:cytochrome oxidase Cu insertion factor (SCO1/SenC/PrrC family)
MLSRRIVLPALLLLVMASPVLAQQKKAAPPEPKIKVGDMAPDFTMNDQNGKPVSLHDFRGKKNVALAFVIFAFSGG